MKNLILSTTFLALSAIMSNAEIVRIGTEGNYRPYNFINDAGEVDGFERELGDELCRRAELTCEWVANKWDSIIPNLVSGKYDAIIAAMSVTAERDRAIDFTQSYMPPATSAYAALSADVNVKSGSVSAQTATVQAGYVAESGAKLRDFATGDEAVAAVRNGKAVAVLADKDFLAPIVAGANGALVFVGEDIVIGDGVAIGLRESETDLKGKFDASIQSMKDDGMLNAMIKKWFGDSAAVF